ncbi:MAG: hypothetical protein F6J94_21755 [Moorea sp. SIO1F2]|uniref:hypothetical protein n=1 Tax=unclassified Moorena TaxID=2683338 RepID=UPI0013B7070B|nr:MULTISPECIES: hypothetical protein [unclassified Moorena]NEO14573.1 hypothetical protein [Moorena sp. SIO3E8]NEP99823.1 hypothetical protein [Moorena sp. SIO3F7]NET84446.1 hypothetical protein [Moorena sp. SIO1F2]
MRYTLFFTSSLFPAPCSRLDAKREWFEFTVRQLSLVLMQSLMGETPKTALPPQDRNGAFDP